MSEIQGVVEDIVFKNDENGYVVAKVSNINQLITIVGCIPFINEGQNLKIKGNWVVHPQFGSQFKVESCEEILPSSLTGIERYLSSGIIAGIGPITARKIVEKFGEDTLDVLDNHIERLSEIEGIGEKKIRIICDSYSTQREVKNVMVFLQTYGITTSQCVKIYKKYGPGAISILKQNPYVLTEDIYGIGFKTADKIARNIGIDSDSSFRIQSGINYIINDFCNQGNTYIPLDDLVSKAQNILGVDVKTVEENIYQCALDQKIKIETINEKQCVFSMIYYYCEISVTRKVISLALREDNNLNLNMDVLHEIDNFEEQNGIKFAQDQKEAIEGVFQNGIEVITGGPGTGKTTIINCIADLFEDMNMKVFMAAPTGRAAKRMTETTGREAKTIHRLLELGFDDDDDMVFFKDEKSPLECDVLIIDEASMIDIILMNNLMKAIGMGTRLIIVGDVDQLPSVGPGNVLNDIIKSGCVKVVRLKHIYRQAEKSLIVVNAHKINNGEMPALNEKNKDFYFINSSGDANILDTIVQLIDVRLPKFNKNWKKSRDIQILTPMRKGVLGVENLNKKLQQILNPKSKNKKEREFRNVTFRVGDKVMQIKNNYTIKWIKVDSGCQEEGIGVFNGDVGYIEDISDENNNIIVVFDMEKRVVYDTLSLEELELAYAITIHKSQGSEFPVVIMPVFMGPPLLMNRNLFYTGITRAKLMVVLVGSLRAIQFMVSNNKSYERFSSLGWRMEDFMKDDFQNQ